MAATTTDEPSERRAKIEAIASDPNLRDEAARVLPELIRMIDGRPTNEELYAAMQPLIVVKRMPDFGKGPEAAKLHQAWLAVYYSLLRKFPVAAVRAGVRDVLAEHVYPDMPQPAEIVKASEPYAVQIRTAHYRLKEATRFERKAILEVDRKENLARMGAAGWLNADGEFDIRLCLGSMKKPEGGYKRPAESPQQMAARLRGDR